MPSLSKQHILESWNPQVKCVKQYADVPHRWGSGHVGSFQEEHFSGLEFNMVTQILIDLFLDAITHKNEMSYVTSYSTHKVYIYGSSHLGFWCCNPVFKRNLSYAKMKSHTKMEVSTQLTFQVIMLTSHNMHRHTVHPIPPYRSTTGGQQLIFHRAGEKVTFHHD